MSLAQPVSPGSTLLLTRRCAQRVFLLTPDDDHREQINQLFHYCVGLACNRFGVRLHAICVMSNHYHLVVTDVEGNCPKFMHWLNAMLARAINVIRGRKESVWAPPPYSRVELLDAETVLEKMVYTLVNPVAAGLVSEGSQWPGVRSQLLRAGVQRMVVQRPDFFFRVDGDLPESVEFLVRMPQQVEEILRDTACESFGDVVLRREAEIRESVLADGRSFLERHSILLQSPSGCPRTTEPSRAPRPRVACCDSLRLKEWHQSLREFVSSYKEALRAFVAGARDVLFPAGTYGLRVHLGVRCAQPSALG